MIHDIRTIANDPTVKRLLELQRHPLMTFQPRPDQPERFDEQTSFCESKAKVSVLLGGNGSGKSTAAANKVARFLLQQQPPTRRDLPFWVVSDSLWQVGQICWGQGLQRFIPTDMIDWPRVKWHSSKLSWPAVVPLLPWPGTNNNWMLEFRSTESGRSKFQGTSNGGENRPEVFLTDPQPI